MNARSGNYRVNLTGKDSYQSFVPTPLPPSPDIEFDNELINLLTKAAVALATLDSVAKRIPDHQLFVASYVRKEALLSSQIEGTQATLEDIFDPLIETNTNRDIEDVVNYVNAANFAINELERLPLCNRLLKDTHRVLMARVRGQDKRPGEFRVTQNLISRRGATLQTAHYIPPNPKDMLKAMHALEDYINADDDVNDLIKAALIHYQFETIHPFLDGNGRIGRMLITLFLLNKNVLTTPALYVSYFLKKYQAEYYSRLEDVRKHGRYEQWVKFFLKALYESAEDAIKTGDELSALRDRNIAVIEKLGRARINAELVFDYMQSRPIIDVTKTARDLNVAFNTASAAINQLVGIGVLVPTTNFRRNRVFVYKDYLEILKHDT